LQLFQQRLLMGQLLLVAGEHRREIMFEPLACDELQRHKITRRTLGARKLGIGRHDTSSLGACRFYLSADREGSLSLDEGEGKRAISAGR
jgi:hypothetical protein